MIKKRFEAYCVLAAFCLAPILYIVDVSVSGGRKSSPTTRSAYLHAEEDTYYVAKPLKDDSSVEVASGCSTPVAVSLLSSECASSGGVSADPLPPLAASKPPDLPDITLKSFAGGIALPSDQRDWPSKRLFEAISKVESNHDDSVIGDLTTENIAKGKVAYGRYQITKAYWKDACWQIAITLGVPMENVQRAFNYTFGVTDPRICEIIMHYYWIRYDCRTDEQKARCHNGGSRGMEKEATKDYWEKVQKHMEKSKNF